MKSKEVIKEEETTLQKMGKTKEAFKRQGWIVRLSSYVDGKTPGYSAFLLIAIFNHQTEMTNERKSEEEEEDGMA